MNFQEAIKKRRKAHLKDKFTNKEYSENWHGLRVAMLPISYLIQIITAVCAVAIPAYWVQVISGSWAVGFVIGAVILFAFEYVKRLVVNKTALGYFNKGKVSIAGSVAVLCIIGLSIASSGFGTPILIHEFAPMPAKPIESDVIKPFHEEKTALIAHWSNVKKDAEQKANEVHNSNNWRGVTVKGARATVLGFKNQAKAATDSLNSALSVLNARQVSAVDKANAEYEVQTANRNEEKTNVGFWVALFTLALELIFIICYSWLNYYDFREALELGLISFESSKSDFESSTITEKVVQSKKKAVPQQRPSAIGFNNEGKVISDGGKLKIICKKANGELKAYDSAYLSTLISSCEGNRREYFKGMKSKLKSYKN